MLEVTAKVENNEIYVKNPLKGISKFTLSNNGVYNKETDTFIWKNIENIPSLTVLAEETNGTFKKGGAIQINIDQSQKEEDITEGDWTAKWDSQLGRYKLTNYTGDKTNVQVPTTFKNKPVAISLVEMSDTLNLKDLTSFSATGTNNEIKVLDTDWSNLFKDSKATTIDMRGFDVSNVSNMFYLFANCVNLTEVNVKDWDVSHVTSMESMFQYCSNLTTLDVSNWNTSNVTNMSGLFKECRNLTNADVSNWDTSKVTNMYGVFYECRKLANLDLSKWNTEKVTSWRSMFYNCIDLTALDLSNWNASTSIKDAQYMFDSMKNCVIIGHKDTFTRFSDISLDVSNIWLEDVVNTVNTLFKDDTHTVLNDGITQDKINDAKKEVDKLPDSLSEKKELSELVAKAQELLDQCDEITKVNPYVLGNSEWITGTLKYRNAALIGIEINGQVQAIVPSDDLKNGTFQYYIGSGLKSTDKVEVVLYTAEHAEITRQAAPIEEAAKDEKQVKNLLN